MGIKVVTFLGPPREAGRANLALRYQFGNYLTKPSRVLGVALFRWLCAEHEIPSEIIIIGGPDSDWDLLYELAAITHDAPSFLRLGLREAIAQRRLDQNLLDILSSFLSSYLGSVSVRCILAPLEQGRRGQVRAFSLLDELVVEGDELHIDATHDIWSCGLAGLAAATFLSEPRRIEVGGLYLAQPAASTPAGTPVLILRDMKRLADWSSSLALFRSSGLLGKLPELFEEESRELGANLKAINFGILTHQYEDIYDRMRDCKRALRALATQQETRGAFFARQFLREAGWLTSVHVADWQIEFARRALFSMDYSRAAMLAQEAVVSAAIARTSERILREKRARARADLLHERYRKSLYPVDPWPFLTLWKVRAALAGLDDAPDESLSAILATEESLRHFLERAISFAAVLVARFRRVPPF